MDTLFVNITLKLRLRDYGAFEDLMGELGAESAVSSIELVKGQPIPKPKELKHKGVRRRMNGSDVVLIKRLLEEKGADISTVAEATHWSRSTIQRVADGERDRL